MSILDEESQLMDRGDWQVEKRQMKDRIQYLTDTVNELMSSVADLRGIVREIINTKHHIIVQTQSGAWGENTVEQAFHVDSGLQHISGKYGI